MRKYWQGMYHPQLGSIERPWNLWGANVLFAASNANFKPDSSSDLRSGIENVTQDLCAKISHLGLWILGKFLIILLVRHRSFWWLIHIHTEYYPYCFFSHNNSFELLFYSRTNTCKTGWVRKLIKCFRIPERINWKKMFNWKMFYQI